MTSAHLTLAQKRAAVQQALVANQGLVPLSWCQKGLRIVQDLAQDPGLFNLGISLHLRGPLDGRTLRRALERVVDRHPALRTVFVRSQTAPFQRFQPHMTLEWQQVDARAVSEQAFGEQRQLLRGKPFDAESGPLLRGALWRRGTDVHVLGLCLHHAICDMWSLLIIRDEVFQVYDALVNERPVNLPKVPSTYAAAVRRERDLLASAQGLRMETFWRDQLVGHQPLQLPIDHPRPSTLSQRSDSVAFAIPATVADRLLRVAQKLGTTRYTLLLAALQVLLHRYSDQTDFVVGSPMLGRTHPDLLRVVGYFTNVVPLRAQMSGNPPFTALLTQTAARVSAAHEHQDYPFPLIVEACALERDPSRAPIYQVAFSYVQRTDAVPAVAPSQADTSELGSIVCEAVSISQPVGILDQLWFITEATAGLTGQLVFSPDLFDRATAERMTQHLAVLLSSIVANPEQAISELPLLTPAERHEQLVAWNATERDYPRHQTLHGLVVAQAARTPDSIALVCDGQALTYRELDARSNRLAHRLRSVGVGPGILVGIYLARSVELVVGLLGILKAGGAYVPLDPSYPAERLAFMLADTGVPVLVTQAALQASLPDHEATVVALDTDWPAIGQEPDTVPATTVGPEDTAYVIYTSGSTGRPKGVVIPHRAVVNFLAAMAQTPGLSPDDVVLGITTLSFDPSVLELYLPLTVGAHAIIASRAVAMDAALLAAAIQAHRVTVLQATPSTWRMLLESGWTGSTGLKALIGGEALTRELANALCRVTSELWNVYGPTETTVWSAVHRIHEDDGPILIGRPIGNMQYYILDAAGHPVPVGVPGELHIGGDGIGRGYLGRPELTAESYIPNSFGPGRLYKSGDLCRFMPDGNLKYLGRIDHQVKIRGYRVEMGEIEAVLSEHEDIREAVVIAREDQPGDQRLVAYLVPAKSLATSDLRNYAKARLPDYMVPSAFVWLDVMPLTPNGKVDRKALPAPDYALDERTLVAPRTPLEATVAAMWAEVLGVDTIGIHDNFFELGGHSLLATQVVARVRRNCEVELPLRDLFDAPTVASLAAHVLDLQNQGAGGELATIVPIARDQHLPLSFAQQRLWFLDQLEPSTAAYNIPGAVRLHGALAIEALLHSLNELVRRHEALRTTFRVEDGRAYQVVGTDRVLPLPCHDLRGGSAAEREQTLRRWAATEAQAPFELTTGPLFRGQLLRLGEDDHVLLVTLHHIVADGWSMGVLVRELAALYEAFSQDKPSPLPELPLQYVDYADWQRHYLQGAVLDRQLRYWRDHLAGAPSLLALPTDKPRPPVQTHKGATLPVRLPRDLSAQVLNLSNAHGATVYMTLLAAFNVLLQRYCGQTDLVVGTPIANRRQAEVEGLIGCFVNTLAIRNDVSGDPSFAALLARVKAATLGAYAHQDLPFAHVVDALQPERTLAYAPVFQVMFALQNAPFQALRLPGLTLSPLALEAQTAKFDLTVSLSASDEGLVGAWEYATDLFEPETIVRMAAHFQVLLEGIVADPDRLLSELPLLTEAERVRQLVTWNATAADYPQDQTVHGLVAAQAARTPDSLAIEFQGQTLTYRELDARSNQLAHHLQKLGVGPGVLVGIGVERSLQMVIGLLGILKAGGAYVPLDPSYPAERLAFMLADSRVSVLLTQAALQPILPDHDATVAVVALDTDWPAIAREPDSVPATSTAPEDTAYVIYTSGSTGKPKGVVIPHRALVNFLSTMAQTPGLSPHDVLLAVTTLSFDIAGLELFLPLTVGAKVVVATRAVAADAERLAAAIEADRVTVMQATPATWRMLLDSGWTGSKGLKALVGGEALPRTLANALRRVQDEVWNMFGPTETTIWSAVHQIQEGDGPILIGRPIGNTQLYILDERRQPVPLGVSGELHIGGDGLAQGYLNRPELTAETFIANPFGEGRLYRTGDLACYRTDGAVACLGRIDQQVKVRGYRIELGEIEATLVQHPLVREVSVIVREDQPGDKRLVAYLVPLASVETEELRDYVKGRLPDYMVPAAFVQLEVMPLTPNGKVDRKALPAPHQTIDVRTCAAPRTPMEATLAAIWSEVLGLQTVGVTDNFFELGGHSLLVTQVVARIRQTCQVEVPLRDLFEAPTVASLAERVVGLQNALLETSLAIMAEGDLDAMLRALQADGGSVL